MFHWRKDSGGEDGMKTNKRKKKKKQVRPRSGLLEQFKSERTFHLSEIDSIVRSVLLSHKDKLSRTTAARILLPLDSEKWGELQPHIMKIAEEARDRTSFRCKDLWVGGPSICVAPPVHHIRVRHRVNGAIHRDMEKATGCGVHTFSLCVDEVARENGAIEIWRKSINCECHPKHPGRGLLANADIPSEILTGEEGTVFAWDSRMLHRSVKSVCKEQRITLIWCATNRKAARNFKLLHFD